MDSTAAVIQNGLIAGNLAANSGAGLYLRYDATTLVNTTVAGNRAAAWRGGGIYCWITDLVILNTIVWGNASGAAPAEIELAGWADWGYSTLDARYSVIGGGDPAAPGSPWPGSGNILANPDFRDPRSAAEAPTTAGNYHIRLASPCRDTGTGDTATWPLLPAADVDGDARPQGSGYDMGCDEHDNRTPVATGQAVETLEDSAAFVTLAATDADDDPLVYAVRSGPAHGSLAGTTPDLVYVPAADYSGTDSFTFVASDGVSESAAATVTITIGAVNDAPTDIRLSNSSVPSSAAAGTPVGTLSTVDADIGDAFAYALVPGAGDNASFEIFGAELRVLVPLESTARDSFSVHVTSTDLAGASTEKVFAVKASSDAYVLWTRSDTGQAVLWKIDPGAGSGTPKVIPVSSVASVRSTTGVGRPWLATSYAHVSATEGYVLWTRSDTGQAVLWKVDPSAAGGTPKVIPVGDQASLRSTTGVGRPWQGTSYAHVSATEGYVLWTRADTGQAVLWKIDPSAAGGTPKVIPVSYQASLRSASGVGAPWQATSYAHVSATEGYVLWTRNDTGQAVLWKIDPTAGGGVPKVIPVSDLASVRSAAGVGRPWQATSYQHVSATEGYVLWTRSDTGQAVLWKIDPGAASGTPKIIPVADQASLRSTGGVGGPWEATSFSRIVP